ncbi:hypothetical protein M0P65_02885 [Candidatus Gracilibacteria bacterium]|nr:hypothetical protein [Candidatus Gracilibacteria bacterium]
MSKIIRLDGYKKEKEGDKLDRRILTKSIEEYLVLAKKFKEEVTNILDRRDGILRITQEELEKIFKNSILDFLIKKRQISSELFMCGDYVSIILRKFICGDIDLHKFTQDFLEEGDWKGAGDINLVKYIYGV